MSATIAGKSGEWEIVVGIETHAHVTSKAKLFSGASTAFGAEPNTQVSPVDAAFPGMLPVINRFCIEQAVKTGLGLNAEINLTSVFDRKNYFYADLPAGYQISQFTRPIVGKGKIALDMPDGAAREIGITRLHLEQDAGKSLHDQHPSLTYVDLNRAGVALMEIVSEPDIRSAEEAGAYVRKLRSIMRYLGTCDGNMEEGSLRCDCNVSVRKPGAPLGTRCEIKNVNSVRFVMQAIDYEARRQIGVLEEGGRIEQQTRLYDAAKGETRPMRSKEESHDYRYFPDPDLLPLVLDKAWVEKLKAGLPELPDAKKARFVRDYKLSPYDALVLAGERGDAEYFETVAKGRDPKLASNWVTVELFGALNKSGKTIADSPVKAEDLGELIDLISDGTLSGRLAKDVFAAMIETGKGAKSIVAEKGLKQVTDSGEIERAIDGILAKESANIAKYRAGNEKLLGYFVGQVMKATGGRANPALLNELLKKKLAISSPNAVAEVTIKAPNLFGAINLDTMNEADVREVIIRPFLHLLGYRQGTPANILTEKTLRYSKAFLGHKKPARDPDLVGRPDYICDVVSFGRWIVEVKSPRHELTIEDAHQAHTYAAHPEIGAIFSLVTNGRQFSLYRTSQPDVPIYTWKIEDTSRFMMNIQNLLSPEAIKRRVFVKIDLEKPLAFGYGSSIEMVGGFIVIRRHVSDAPILATLKNSDGTRNSVVGKKVYRTPSGQIQGELDVALAHGSLDQIGKLARLTPPIFISSEEFISIEKTRPTIFQNFHMAKFSKGMLFPSLPGSPNTAGNMLLFNIETTGFTEAVGYIEKDKFIGSFEVSQKILFTDVPLNLRQIVPPEADTVAEGTFEILIR